MSETMKHEGMLLTLKVTAASNMSAGDMVGISGTLAYSLGSATIDNTAVLGYAFAGILDEDISAGQCPINVFTEGVFKMKLASGATDANILPGWPVWTDGSGYVTTPGPNGDACIGTLVGIQTGTWSATGGGVAKNVFVKIAPIMYKWSVASPASLTATAPIAGGYPAAVDH